jgi:hypothetical protein
VSRELLPVGQRDHRICSRSGLGWLCCGLRGCRVDCPFELREELFGSLAGYAGSGCRRPSPQHRHSARLGKSSVLHRFFLGRPCANATAQTKMMTTRIDERAGGISIMLQISAESVTRKRGMQFHYYLLLPCGLAHPANFTLVKSAACEPRGITPCEPGHLSVTEFNR